MEAAERRELVKRAHFGRKQMARSRKGMACTSHPIVSWVAVDTLKKGGNAADAALAASITQTVVEPHMTTITGVLSMLHFDAATRQTTYVNGSMNAPLSELKGFNQKDLGSGRGACVPGWWAGFEAALERHGTRTKKDLMSTAIELARDGFEIHPFLYGEMFAQCHLLGKYPEGREIFMPEGCLLDVGETLRQASMARTLERLRDEGSDYFYRGDFEAVLGNRPVRQRSDHRRGLRCLPGALAGTGPGLLPGLHRRGVAAARQRLHAHRRSPQHDRAPGPPAPGAAHR